MWSATVTTMRASAPPALESAAAQANRPFNRQHAASIRTDIMISLLLHRPDVFGQVVFPERQQRVFSVLRQQVAPDGHIARPMAHKCRIAVNDVRDPEPGEGAAVSLRYRGQIGQPVL